MRRPTAEPAADAARRPVLAAALMILALAGAGAGPAPPPGPPLEIAAVQRAAALPSPVVVIGVVSARNVPAGTFALIDRAEFSRCRQAGCAPFSLPVRWTGTLPPVLAAVSVRGTVRDAPGGKILVADRVEIVKK